MANTPNYNLEKPGEEEFYDVNVQNRNMDTIDIELKKTNDALDEHQAEDTIDAHNAGNISVMDTAGNFTATDVEGVLEELFTNVSNGKSTSGSLATAITDKGGTLVDGDSDGVHTFQELTDGVGSIQVGDYSVGDLVPPENFTLEKGIGSTVGLSTVVSGLVPNDSSYFYQFTPSLDYFYRLNKSTSPEKLAKFNMSGNLIWEVSLPAGRVTIANNYDFCNFCRNGDLLIGGNPSIRVSAIDGSVVVSISEPSSGNQYVSVIEDPHDGNLFMYEYANGYDVNIFTPTGDLVRTDINLGVAHITFATWDDQYYWAKASSSKFFKINRTTGDLILSVSDVFTADDPYGNTVHAIHTCTIKGLIFVVGRGWGGIISSDSLRKVNFIQPAIFMDQPAGKITDVYSSTVDNLGNFIVYGLPDRTVSTVTRLNKIHAFSAVKLQEVYYSTYNAQIGSIVSGDEYFYFWNKYAGSLLKMGNEGNEFTLGARLV